MNSLHLRTIYWFSSMTDFRQATLPTRSIYAPPSRTWPAFASLSAVGDRISPIDSQITALSLISIVEIQGWTPWP